MQDQDTTNSPVLGVPSDTVQRAWIALQRVGPLLQDRVEEKLAANGLPDLSTYTILWALDRAGKPVRPRDLGQLLFLPRYKVSRQIDRLVETGLVRKQKCPEDARGHLLSLTPKGKKVRLDIWAVYAPAMGGVMAGISDAEARSMTAILDKLA